MSDDSNWSAQVTRRRILAGVTTIGTASSAAGAGTFALFDDSETSSGNTVQAGTLDLELNGTSGITVPTGGLAPTESTHGSINLNNAGTLAGDHVEMTFSIVENDKSTPTDFEFQTDESALAFANQLEVRTLTYGSTDLASNIDTVAQLDRRVFDDLPVPDSTTTLDFDLRLKDIGNTFQADGVDLVCQFALAQEASQDFFGTVRDGLLAHYRLDSVDDGTAENAAGSAPDGSVGTNVTSAIGTIGTAASFVGTNDRITVPDDPSLDLTGPYSESAWVYLNSTGGFQDITMKDPGQWALGFQVRNGQLRAGFEDESDNNYIGVKGTGGSIPVKTWTHLAVVYDGNRVLGYINGSQVFEVTESTDGTNIDVSDVTPSTNDEPLQIGSGERNFDGRIDDLRIYDRALTSAEVNDLASM